MISLTRYYTPQATWGTLRVGDFECATIEREWAGNAVGESCIPEGEYRLRLRSSPIVQRTSGCEFEEGWEVCDVPERTWIMLHPANWAHQLQGCIAPGREHVIMRDKLAVNHSRDTFRELMSALDGRNEWVLTIQGFRP